MSRKKVGTVENGNIYLGKRLGNQLIGILLDAYINEADQEARRLLYSCWPDGEWDDFAREHTGSALPMRITKEAA